MNSRDNKSLSGTVRYSPKHKNSGAETRSPDEAGDNLELRLALSGKTDFANGQRLRTRFGNDVIYVPGSGYLVWDGLRWKPDRSNNAVRRMAHETAGSIAGEIDALRQDGADRQEIESLRKWQVTSLQSARTEGMIRESKPYLERSVDDLDTHHFIFNATDCTIDLLDPPEHWEAGADAPFVTARTPLRDDLIMLKANAPYDPVARCPQWERFLVDILPDPAMRRFIQGWAGYLLTGSVEEQVLVICHGIGANGKSTLMGILDHVLGDYAAGLPFASILHDERKRGSEATPDIARLRGVRLVIASEPDIGARFSESVIKQITGGERLIARPLHQPFFEFPPAFKLMLSVNSRPQIRGQDEGIWRRLLMVPFDEVIPPERRDRHLVEKLKAEESGILNWMIDGYCNWRMNGLEVPLRVREAIRDYRESEDPVGGFLSSETRREINSSVSAKNLYQAYVRWCQENGETEVSRNAFGRMVSERGFQRVKSGTIFYRGIELVRPAAEPDDSDGLQGAGGDEGGTI